jgi:hypothetical protein
VSTFATRCSVLDYNPADYLKTFEAKISPEGVNFIVRLADLIPSRYGIVTEDGTDGRRQLSDRVTFYPLDYQSVSVAECAVGGYGYDLGDGVIGQYCAFYLVIDPFPG